MEYKSDYTREELQQICEDAVVPFKEWCDRDSYSAQVNIQTIYEGLTSGLSYKINTDEKDIIWIDFDKPTKEQLNKMKYLEIDSRDDYIEWYLEDNDNEYPEIFNGNGIDWSNNKYRGGYMPTRLRLKEKKDGDWY